MSLKNHLTICEKRDKQCNFCTLYIKYHEYTDHVYICSSRSQLCPYCHKYIIMRDYEYHIETIHDNGVFEGKKCFNPIKGPECSFDFTKKNPFYQDKMKKAFKSEASIRRMSQEIPPLNKEDECELNKETEENEGKFRNNMGFLLIYMFFIRFF